MSNTFLARVFFYTEDGSDSPPKRRCLQDPHGATSQKTAFFNNGFVFYRGEGTGSKTGPAVRLSRQRILQNPPTSSVGICDCTTDCRCTDRLCIPLEDARDCEWEPSTAYMKAINSSQLPYTSFQLLIYVNCVLNSSWGVNVISYAATCYYR
jgi:hypothetical protein